jgi:hypothetical protein
MPDWMLFYPFANLATDESGILEIEEHGPTCCQSVLAMREIAGMRTADVGPFAKIIAGRDEVRLSVSESQNYACKPKHPLNASNYDGSHH